MRGRGRPSVKVVGGAREMGAVAMFLRERTMVYESMRIRRARRSRRKRYFVVGGFEDSSGGVRGASV